MKKIIKIISLIGMGIFIILLYYGFHLGIFKSPDKLQVFIEQFGKSGILMFILLQIIQVIVPIFPGGMSSAAGMLMFGTVNGLIYSCIGLIIGEMIGFVLVRKYGKPFVGQILPEKGLNKMNLFLEKGEKHIERILISTFLIPFAPDDIACYAAGMTNMKFSKFFWTVFLLKPWSVGMYSYLMLVLLKKA